VDLTARQGGSIRRAAGKKKGGKGGEKQREEAEGKGNPVGLISFLSHVQNKEEGGGKKEEKEKGKKKSCNDIVVDHNVIPLRLEKERGGRREGGGVLPGSRFL